MPRGLPDYGLLQAQTVSIEEGNINASALDVGYSLMDGGGRVVFFEDFRSGANRFDLYNGGVGVAPYIKSTLGVGAGFYPSLYLDPGGYTGYSFAELQSNCPVSGKIGVEFGYYLESLHGVIKFNLAYQYSLDVNYNAKFRLNYYTDSVGYWNGSAFVDLFPIGAPGLLLGNNFSLKFVIDGVNGLFAYLLVGDYKIPMGYPLITASGGVMPGRYVFHLQNYSITTSFKKGMYLNYLVISADEP